MDKVKVMVLKPQQLADRWQLSLSKIYEDNSAGKLPHLKINRNRFPLKAIERLENEVGFDKNDIQTSRERELNRKIDQLEDLIQIKNKEIFKFKQIISKIHVFLTEYMYEDTR